MCVHVLVCVCVFVCVCVCVCMWVCLCVFVWVCLWVGPEGCTLSKPMTASLSMADAPWCIPRVCIQPIPEKQYILPPNNFLACQ